MSLPLPSSLLELISVHFRHNTLSNRSLLVRGSHAPCRRVWCNDILRRHAHALALKPTPATREMQNERYGLERSEHRRCAVVFCFQELTYDETNSNLPEVRPAWLPKEVDTSLKSPSELLREQVENLISRPLSEVCLV